MRDCAPRAALGGQLYDDLLAQRLPRRVGVRLRLVLLGPPCAPAMGCVIRGKAAPVRRHPASPPEPHMSARPKGVAPRTHAARPHTCMCIVGPAALACQHGHALSAALPCSPCGHLLDPCPPTLQALLPSALTASAPLFRPVHCLILHPPRRSRRSSCSTPSSSPTRTRPSPSSTATSPRPACAASACRPRRSVGLIRPGPPVDQGADGPASTSLRAQDHRRGAQPSRRCSPRRSSSRPRPSRRPSGS